MVHFHDGIMGHFRRRPASGPAGRLAACARASPTRCARPCAAAGSRPGPGCRPPARSPPTWASPATRSPTPTPSSSPRAGSPPARARAPGSPSGRSPRRPAAPARGRARPARPALYNLRPRHPRPRLLPARRVAQGGPPGPRRRAERRLRLRRSARGRVELRHRARRLPRAGARRVRATRSGSWSAPASCTALTLLGAVLRARGCGGGGGVVRPGRAPGPADAARRAADPRRCRSTNGARTRAELWRRRTGAVLLTPAHQFPTGVPLHPGPPGGRVDWARRTGGLILEDDYDGEFRYDRQPVGALQGLDPDRVVYLGTASKSLAPGLRLGWMVLPPALRGRRSSAAKGGVDWTCGALDQLTLAEFIASGRVRPPCARRPAALPAPPRPAGRGRGRTRAGGPGQRHRGRPARGARTSRRAPSRRWSRRRPGRAWRCRACPASATRTRRLPRRDALVVGYGTPPDSAWSARWTRCAGRCREGAGPGRRRPVAGAGPGRASAGSDRAGQAPARPSAGSRGPRPPAGSPKRARASAPATATAKPEDRQPRQALAGAVAEPHHAHHRRADRLADHHARRGRRHRAALERRGEQQERRAAAQQQCVQRRVRQQRRAARRRR